MKHLRLAHACASGQWGYMKFRQVKLETIAGQRSPLWCFGGPGPWVLAHGLLAASHMVCLRPMPLLCLLSAALLALQFSRMIADSCVCFVVLAMSLTGQMLRSWFALLKLNCIESSAQLLRAALHQLHQWETSAAFQPHHVHFGTGKYTSTFHKYNNQWQQEHYVMNIALSLLLLSSSSPPPPSFDIIPMWQHHHRHHILPCIIIVVIISIITIPFSHHCLFRKDCEYMYIF